MFAVNRRLPALLAVLALAALAGCSSNNDDDDGLGAAPAAAPPAGQAFVEVIHASADAPPVDLLVNGAAAFTNVDFKDQVSATLDAGTIEVEVVGLLPNDGEATVIPAAGEPAPQLTLAPDSRVTVLAIGNVADIAPAVIVDRNPEVPDDEVRIRVLHATPDAVAPGDSTVEVWLSNPEANLIAPAGTDTIINAVFSFGEQLTSNPLQVPAGDYRVRVTRPGAPGAVLFDSGTLPLPGGANLVIAAVPNTTAGLVRNAPSPITLVASTGEGILEFVNNGTPATVRAIHASSDTDPVDIVVGGAVAIPGLTYLASGGDPVTAPLPAGAYVFDLAESPYAPGDAFALSIPATLEAGKAVSVLAIGSSTLQPADFPLKALLLVDQTRSIATEAQVRIVHASVLAENVDIYVLPGDSLPPVGDIPDGTAAFLENVPYEAVTEYVSLAEGSYDIAVTPTGDPTPAIGPVTIPVAAGGIYTIIALDGPDQTVPLTAVVLDDSL